ncbi:hypothetical protein [Agrobacterium rosae]|uniref:hypothetical protein n=1 Tax=Agrobacterium rosae TaxID=1972867 RepID=UPI003BA23777
MKSTVKYFCDINGVYLGAWDGYKGNDGKFIAPEYPQGAITVSSPPPSGDSRQKFDISKKEWFPLQSSVEDYEIAVQSLIDNTAKQRQFRDGVTLASYVNSTDKLWAAEAAVFVAWRDAVWKCSYAEFDKVQNGERAQPTVAEFLAELTPIVWPSTTDA